MAGSPGKGVMATPDCRVRCFNKRLLGEVLELCGEFSRALLQSQSQSLEAREQELLEARGNFEMALQENVSIDGNPWHEATESPRGLDIKILEDEFDEVIVDVATKRKYYPRKILTHVSKTLKAEREMLGLYQPVVNQEQIRPDPNQLSHMADLTAEMSNVSKRLGETMKSLPALIEKTEGLSQVLSLHPILQLSRTHNEVFSDHPAKEKEKEKVIGLSHTTDLEMTPTETGTMNKIENNRKRKRSELPESKFYPLRKRKISLNA